MHLTLGGHCREVSSLCSGRMLAKAVGLASSPASPEGTSKCLMTIWTRQVFSSLDSGTVPMGIGTSGCLG